MPELGWQFGYPFALLLMVAASLSVWIISKRAGWL
jgi:magnesium transporter